MASQALTVLPAHTGPAALALFLQVLLGVQLDAAAAARLVDMGPPAEDAAAAAEFRAFWGDKAELRRFPVSRALSVCPRPAFLQASNMAMERVSSS